MKFIHLQTKSSFCNVIMTNKSKKLLCKELYCLQYANLDIGKVAFLLEQQKSDLQKVYLKTLHLVRTVQMSVAFYQE